MQTATVSQSNREDEKPRFILLASLKTDARRIELDSRHLQADYRPLASRLQAEQNFGLMATPGIADRVNSGFQIFARSFTADPPGEVSQRART
jgi:hypothetical protein